MNTRAESPPIPSTVLGAAAYIATAVMLFGGFISAYLVLRAGESWPAPGELRLPLAVSGANTAVLLASGVMALRGVRGSLRALRAAVLLGVVFLAVQGFEWTRLVDYGVTASSGAFGAVFTSIVGAHALHVLGGLVFLAWSAVSAEAPRDRVLAATLYWGFVVLVWPVLYALLYLV